MLDEESAELPEVKKRRRPRPKPVQEDDDDAGPSRGRPAPGGDDEEENSDLLPSSGNVLLDILLDFIDDCKDWAKANFVMALVIGIVSLLLALALLGLTIRYIINYINRPTIVTTEAAYRSGAYVEARNFAETVLKYADPNDRKTHSDAYFILGASTSAIADIAWDSQRQPYYLTAANYLAQADQLGFTPARRFDGPFLLGRALYLSGELEQCREPLLEALKVISENEPEYIDDDESREERELRQQQRERVRESNQSNVKLIYWYMANSWFMDKNSNPDEALRYLKLFQKNPLVIEEERYESYLLQALILIQKHDIPAAENVLKAVPRFERFETMRHFIQGQTLFLQARQLRRQAKEIIDNRNPMSISDAVLAPGPVKPIDDSDEPQLLLPKQNSDDLPDSGGTSPFDETDTQRLLPGKEPEFQELEDDQQNPTDPVQQSQPDLGPWRIVSPVPVAENDPFRTEEPLFKRMSWLVAQAQPAQQEKNVLDSEPASTEPASTEPESTEPVKDLSDTILVLPTQKSVPRTQAPLPIDLALPGQEKSYSDPRLIQAEKIKEQGAEKYLQAIEYFQRVRHRDTFVPRWIRTAELLEGVCYAELGTLDKAQATFLNLSETYPESSEGIAAIFFYAEIQRQLGQTEKSLAGFDKAFQRLRANSNYACPWLTKEMILQRSVEVLDQTVRMKDFSQVIKLLYLLREIMPEPDRLRYRADTARQWANQLMEQADLYPEPEDTNRRLAEDKFQMAAVAYEELARWQYGESDYETRIWESAECFRLARDFRNSIRMYKKFLELNWKDRQVEARYELGLMYLHLDKLQDAEAELEFTLSEYPTHAMAPRLRLALGRVYFEQKKTDQAKEIVKRNLIGRYAPSSIIYADSIYALAKLHYESGELEESIPYFEDALKLHPNAIQAADAHYCLAMTYLNRAKRLDQEITPDALDEVKYQLGSSVLADQEKALYHIQRAEELLVRRRSAIGLTESEKLMLRNIIFTTGSILMQLERFEQAIPVYDLAATRYQDRPEAIDALLQVAIAYRKLGRPKEAIPILNRAEVILNHLEKTAIIPADHKWKAQIQLQKNMINSD